LGEGKGRDDGMKTRLTGFLVWEKKEERKRGGGSLWIKAFGPEWALDLLFSS